MTTSRLETEGGGEELADPTPRQARGHGDTSLFLASEGASFLTGQTICVGGGVAMW